MQNTYPEKLEAIQPKKLSNVERKRHLQKVKLMQHLFRSGPTAVADIANGLNTSLPTCQTLINELITDCFLERSGKGESIGGRKPDLFGLKDSCFYILCFNMERFATEVAITDNNGNIISVRKYDVAISDNLEALDILYDIAQKQINESGIDTKKLIGVGFAMPGLINWQTGNNQTYLTTTNGQSLHTYLEEKFSLPVSIQNDVKCAATAELNYGLAKGINDVLVVLMDWGIGLGIVMDGQMRKGSQGFSGEIGHIPFVENGALCYCGKRGCLETVASGIALTRLAKEGMEAGQYTLLNELCQNGFDNLEPSLIITAANKGDEFAIKLLSDIGHNLGKGIATLIQLFNPQTIILGGKMAEAKQYITIPIIQSINTYSMTQIRETSNVVLSTLGSKSAILGIKNMVIENLFERETCKADGDYKTLFA
ncbi:ROK family protein [Mucilaginibacter aquatilis]|uniref:ROK family protein n=1 Tax=Mucilaginibacter aquatilis TaxID=1517760 RepID=A0A6I4IQJ8_9SPHI|nr:ROK family protein [Mucilaginibacter aquatilis]MVN91823.1 ROK family protein [Mucilaginibacter aquatilis]